MCFPCPLFIYAYYFMRTHYYACEIEILYRSLFLIIIQIDWELIIYVLHIEKYMKLAGITSLGFLIRKS